MPPVNNAAFFHLEPGSYICFVDSASVDVAAFCRTELPEGVTVQVVPVALKPGQSIAEAVLIQKLDAMDEWLLHKHGSPWDAPSNA
jgi:hypothetical protein